MEAPTAHLARRDPRKVAMATSLLVSLLMLAGKLTAYYLTGSSAIFSDAAESVIHLVATAFVGFSLWYAVQPADPGHPYGHGKIAYFSSGFEGSLIFFAALTILYSGVRALIVGPALRQLGVGLLLIAVLSLVNLALGLYLIRTGRRHNSIVLVSNGQHVLSDVWTSLGVVVGVALVWLTGVQWLDPVIAIAVGLNLAWTALKLIWRAFGGLMEKVDGQDTRLILDALERAVNEQIIAGYHQVRHRRINDQVWIEVHLQFDGRLRLDEAHARSNAVEEAVIALFPIDQVVVTAHLEPDAHDEAHPDGHIEPLDPLRTLDFDS